jgi:hypothetical protein
MAVPSEIVTRIVSEDALSLGVAFGDIDQDGDQDLYVANDFGRNSLLFYSLV